MTIDEKTIIKYLDVVILKSKDISRFNAFTTLSEILDFDNKSDDEKNEIFSLTDSVQRIGITYKYFEELENEINIFRLTIDGIKAKELGGHLKYQKSLKPKTPWIKILPIILTGLLVMLGYLSYNLKVNESDLSNKLDSITKNHVLIKAENVRLLKLTDSLTVENTRLLKLTDSLLNPNKLKTDKLY